LTAITDPDKALAAQALPPVDVHALCRACGRRWTVNGGDAASSPCPACGARKVVSHSQLFELQIAHLDCDAFYASIHKRDDPALASRPVIVGGGQRGVVAAACYMARARGVHSAMPMFKALKACPDAVVIKPQMDLYAREGRAIRKRMLALTPLVQSVSIDEAYLDLSGTSRLHGMPAASALARLQDSIAREHGLTVSVGLSSNRFLAKLASDMDKPNGFAVLAPQDVPAILWPRPVLALHGVGPAMARTLERLSIRTVGDLARANPRRLLDRLGPDALRWIDLANGRDNRAVAPEHKRKSVSAETTFHDDTADADRLKAVLMEICEEVGHRARKQNTAGRSITLKLKTASFRILTRRVTLPEPTATARIILSAARPLLDAMLELGPFRLLGVGLTDLTDGTAADQGDLINTAAPKLAALEQAMDRLNDRYGRGTVASATTRRRAQTRQADTPDTD
jgi:DNA polymerase-4